MKSSKTLLYISLIFLFSQYSCIQTKVSTSSSKGLRTTIFENAKGKVTATLPENIPSGNIISGTVDAEPKGNNVSQKQQNSTVISGYVLDFQNQSEKTSVKNHRWQIPLTNQESKLPLVLKDNTGKILKEVLIPVKEKKEFVQKEVLTASDFSVPDYLSAGETTQLKGVFDGDLNSTSIRLNGAKTNLLAKTPGEVFFEVPENFSGQTDLELTEKKFSTNQKTNILHFEISADKLNLMKGEQTTISFKVSGLEGLETNVPLEYKNMSPGTITMEGGNEHEIIIHPERDAPDGVFTHEAKVSAKIGGRFTVSGYIPPAYETEEIPEIVDSILCDCRINGRSYLLTPEMCEKLKEGLPAELSEIQDEIAEPFYLYFENILDKYEVGETMNLQVSGGEGIYEPVAIHFSYRKATDTVWHKFGTDTTGIDGWRYEFTPHALYTGISEIKAEGVNQQNTVSSTSFYAQIGELSLYDAPTDVVYSVSEADIRRARNRANNARNSITREQERLRRLRDRLAEERRRQHENGTRTAELERIDKVLDKVPETYKDSINNLLDSLQNLRQQLPEEIDSAALHRAKDEAKARLEACKKRLEELQKENEKQENERDRLKKEQDEKLKELHDFFTQNGFTGGYGWHPDGRHWYGYVGDESSNDLTFAEMSVYTRPLRQLKKNYLNVLKQLTNLADDIKNAQEECDRLEEEAKKAEEAANNADLHAATQLAINDICRQIESLLKPLLKWCTDNPDHCYFEQQIRNLMDNCPSDSLAWARFWQNFKNLLDRKKQQEQRFENNAERERDNAESTEGEIDRTEESIEDLEEEEERQNALAEKLRLQREREQEEARQRREERERERNRVQPQPYLDEPVDPRDDQLKFFAQQVFRELYLDLLPTEGCTCKTKALILANNTNTIVSDIIGRIGVGVAFAPLEAFPGIGLAGRLGIGIAKALASSVFGGESLSDELIKNIFSAIGGELFPKLVGNEFTGNRLNDLANKGLEEILEEEGVRAIQWEGSTNSRLCGEISGKTTLMVNPKTGWVVIMIKIPDCPLVVVKYRINDDGVAISKPIIKTLAN